MKNKSFLILILSVVLAMILLGALCSCNTSKLHRTKDVVKTDSTNTKSSDSTNVSTGNESSDSTNVTTTTTGDETDVEIDFTGSNDTGSVTVVVNGDSIHTTGTKPVKVKYKGKATKSTTDSTNVTRNKSNSDSTNTKHTEETSVKKDEVHVEKDKEKSKVPLGIFFLIGGLGVTTLLLFWLLGPPRKRNEA